MLGAAIGACPQHSPIVINPIATLMAIQS